jgi:hypothetical protein
MIHVDHYLLVPGVIVASKSSTRKGGVPEASKVRGQGAEHHIPRDWSYGRPIGAHILRIAHEHGAEL